MIGCREKNHDEFHRKSLLITETIRKLTMTTNLFQPRHRFRSDEEWEKANEPDPVEAAKIALAEKDQETLRLKIQESIRKNMKTAKEIAI
jgi:TPP-dependent pyruvate/acetoin dehydrogenase alpha subunit